MKKNFKQKKFVTCYVLRVTCHAGFTLIELLLSIAIISLIMLVAVPNFREGARQTELSSGAREIVAQAQNIQTMSVAGKTTGFCEGISQLCQDNNECSSSNNCLMQVPAGGYGLHWERSQSRDISVRAYKSDNYSSDAGEALTNYKIIFPTNLILFSLSLDGSSSNALDIIFKPPNGRMHLLNEQGDPVNKAELVLEHEQSKKQMTIVFNAVSGRMEIE